MALPIYPRGIHYPRPRKIVAAIAASLPALEKTRLSKVMPLEMHFPASLPEVGILGTFATRGPCLVSSFANRSLARSNKQRICRRG